jgi:hypothetical protein
MDDLNIDNYTMEDIYHLFKIKNNVNAINVNAKNVNATNFLDEETMKRAKRVVLLTHPDKSRLDAKYFLFYCKAYKKLYAMYEFVNKSRQPTEYEDVLNEPIHKKSNLNNPNINNPNPNQNNFKDSSFHLWFNEQFEKTYLKDEEEEAGYEEWYKSEPAIIDSDIDIESHKRRVQAVTIYKGYDKTCVNTSFGGKLINGSNKTDNFTSSKLFDAFHFTDLKQAYEESVIPVTEEDYQKIPKYRNVDEYKRTRENMHQHIQQMSEKDALLFLEKEREQKY